MRFWPSALADAIAVCVFAVIGRRNHGELSDVAGIWHTAWPFLAGLAFGTLVSRAWRRPASIAGGVPIWVCTLVGGMVVRVLSGNTVALPFVIVAGIVLAVFLLGWRALYVLLRRARERRRASVA